MLLDLKMLNTPKYFLLLTAQDTVVDQEVHKASLTRIARRARAGTENFEISTMSVISYSCS
jgi:hypothetical protein